MNMTVDAWGVLDRRSAACIDGAGENLVGVFAFGHDLPAHMAVGYRVALFRTRREAREAIEEKYGYLRNRPDLKKPPFGWRMPKAVRVKANISVEPVDAS